MQVGAIRVSDTDKKEALLQSKGLRLFNRTQSVSKSDMFGPGVRIDEEVFLAQLALRAKLLNAEFQNEVVKVLETHGNTFNMSTRQIKCAEGSTCRVTTLACSFEEGVGIVEVHAGAPKTVSRMREKLLKYSHPHPKAKWPLCANILDPVRSSIVCRGSSQILQVLSWFTEQQQNDCLPICRLKNKFSFPTERIPDGYRDLQICVLFQGSSGLSIIGEIQIHDCEMHELKLKVILSDSL